MWISLILVSVFSIFSPDKVSCQTYEQIKDEPQDTLSHYRLKYLLQPDTIHYQFIKTVQKSKSGSAFSGYVDFLIKICDTSKYRIVRLDDFEKTIDPDKIIIGIRHDVDLDLNAAYELSEVEHNFGIQSVYYILHTAGYYLAQSNNYSVHNESIIPILKIMQNDYNHRIGWHNDLVTLQLVYNIDPEIFLHQELGWLRNNGISIRGTASHGSSYCYIYNYLNYYFFEDFKDPVIGQFVNNDSALVNGNWVKIKHARLSDFGLDYEAYFLNNNRYYSDASFVDKVRWNVGMLDLESLSPGDRVIILIHPVYYRSNGSSMAEITSFRLPGQFRSGINAEDGIITVEMPAGSENDCLRATFSISPYARALLGLKELRSDQNTIDFTNPVKIKVIAENGLAYRDWLINVINSEDSVPVGIDEISDSRIGVYPNPAHSVLYIKGTDQNSIISITDLGGKIIMNEKDVSNIIDISSLRNGIYMIKVSNNGKTQRIKFVKN